MSESKCYGRPSLTDAQYSEMAVASGDFASQKACLWCYMMKQKARSYDHKKYKKLTKLPRKHNKSSELLPKDLKLNPAVPGPRFIFSTAEGKRRAWKSEVEQRAKHCRRKEIKAHSFNSLCTIQEADEKEEDDDESATVTNLFYNLHMCAHVYESARPTGSGPRNQAIHRLVKICGLETSDRPNIAELQSKGENFGRL
ncbi:hypothetical protein CRV24_006823 [Beauveria bassiana]|nr:hypothetical protein CRV24_006823 [Beauveria bassiana]KAH8713020.1 hypothetical protein HC256_006195 [Beauveria bassiana]